MRSAFAILVPLRLFKGERFFVSSKRIKSRVKKFTTFVSAFDSRQSLHLFNDKSRLSGIRFLILLCTAILSLAITTNGQTTQTYNSAGTSTFIVPKGVTTINVQAWGGGGCSGYNTSGRARGGGGGGAYTEGIMSVTPGASITIVVGAGGIYNNNNTTTDNGGTTSVGTLVANGGSRGVIGNNIAVNGGTGGTVSTNPGVVTSFLSFAGGNGGNGYVAGDNGGGGGGGASASSAGAGDPGSNGTAGGGGGTGGTGTAGGGDGGRGADNDGRPNSADGTAPGGGGGGRGDYSGSDRNGAVGQVIITWTIPAGYCIGNATEVLSHQGVTNEDRSLNAPDNSFVTLADQNDQLALKLGDLLNAGGSIDITWRRSASTSSNPLVNVELSTNGISWTSVNSYTVTSLTWTTQTIPLVINTQYVRFTELNTYNLDIDAVSYYTPCGMACITPVTFNMTGGGNYCTGGGLPVGLSGSETGVDYQLYLNAVSQGSPLPGTGLALDFGSLITAGTYTVTATRLAGGCTATMNGNAVIVISKPAQPSVITGSTTSCVGSSQTYSVTNVPGVTYTWTFPSGWTQTSGGTGNSVTVIAGSTIGNITVTPSTACGIGTARSLTVTATLPLPSMPATISGKTAQCPGVTGQVYSIPAAANATSYSWSVPTGWTITGGAGTTSITTTTGSAGQDGNITVTAINSCGASAEKILPVTVSPLPIPAISANYCAGGGYIRLTANGGGAGATYLWSTDETTQSILVNIAGQYSVDVTNSAGCSATAVYNVSTELVTNGDFSAGNTGFTHSTYGYRADVAGNTELNPEGLYGVGPDPQAFHSNFWGRDHTTGSGNFMIVNGFPGSPQPVVWSTTVAVVPGVSYYFSAWALSLNTAGNYAILQFRVNNTLVGTTAPLPARPQNNNPPYNWIQFYGTWTAPAGVFSVPIEIVDFQTAAAGNDFGLDDISFATLAPLPATIAPTTNAGGSPLCPGQTLQLFANLTGGKAPFTYSWTGPAGFTSTIANPIIPNITIANAGSYTLTITDGYGCTPVTVSTSPAKIVPGPVCSVTGPATLCPSSSGNSYTAPAGMSTYAWSITGNATIAGSANASSVSVTAGAINNTPFTLSLTMVSASGCSSTCQQLLQVSDNLPPTFTLPLLSAGYCVEYVFDALYNQGQENTPLDITYIRPDYYLFANGSTLLNLGSVADNCALAINPIAWTIDFGNNGSIELSGTGQLSTHGADIQFPLGTNRINYTVTDAVGNVTVQFVDLIVTPRPVISNNF